MCVCVCVRRGAIVESKSHWTNRVSVENIMGGWAKV